MLSNNGPASPGEACVDGETMAAWTAGALRTDEASAVENHVAGCARCRALMAAFIKTTPDEPPTESLCGDGIRYVFRLPLPSLPLRFGSRFRKRPCLFPRCRTGTRWLKAHEARLLRRLRQNLLKLLQPPLRHRRQPRPGKGCRHSPRMKRDSASTKRQIAANR